MKLYKKYITWYNQGIEVGKRFCDYEFSENELNDELIKITWENLDKVYMEYGLLAPFTIFNFKNNRIIEFWDWSLFCSKEYRHISSKKYPVLPLTYKITYEEVNNLSIKDILEIAPAEKAIKYLVERGLNMEK